MNSLDVRDLMAVENADTILKGLSRRQRFSRNTTIQSFFYLHVYYIDNEVSIQNVSDWFKALAKIQYNGIPICEVNEKQVSWNFELMSVIKSIKNPNNPTLKPLPPRVTIRRSKAVRGRPRKVLTISPPVADNHIRIANAMKQVNDAVSLKKQGIVFMFGIPSEQMKDKELTESIRTFMKSIK